MTYKEALEFLQSFPDMERATYGARGPTMGLPAMKALLARMGDPHKGTPTIHITGSKGKGSTSAFLNSMLVAAGMDTALYTSPHLHDYTERIAFGLEAVSEADFARGVEKSDSLSKLNAPTATPQFPLSASSPLSFSIWSRQPRARCNGKL